MKELKKKLMNNYQLNLTLYFSFNASFTSGGM